MIAPSQGLAPAKPKFNRQVAVEVARELCIRLKPVCERLIVAGSLRRRRSEVGDVELLYIPKTEGRRIDMFTWATEASLVDDVLADMEERGVLERRLTAAGRETFGEKNKLMRHRATGVPVDLFRATPANWWNYLVCRTGPAESNIQIATRARDKGWQWNPYGEGFSRGGPLAGERQVHVVGCEEEVFLFVGLPYKDPWNR